MKDPKDIEIDSILEVCFKKRDGFLEEYVKERELIRKDIGAKIKMNGDLYKRQDSFLMDEYKEKIDEVVCRLKSKYNY